MEFKIGQLVKIQDTLVRVSAFVENYALATDIHAGIVDGGSNPILLALSEDKSRVTVVTNVERAKFALQQILTKGQFYE